MGTLAAVLRAFADLSPAGSSVPLDVTNAYGPFVWLGVPDEPTRVFGELSDDAAQVLRVRGSQPLRRLAGLDALHRDERLLRAGWVFLAGSIEIDGRRRRVCLPLLSRPIRLRGRGMVAVTPAGDEELLALVDDPEEAARLERAPVFGGGTLDGPRIPQELVDRLSDVQRWIRDVTAAAGMRVRAVLAPEEDLRRHVGEDGLVAVVGIGVYAARDVAATDIRSTLAAWTGVTGLDDTAFGAVYGTASRTTEPGDEPVRSALPLTRAQADVVRRSRTDPVSVVSGGPGSGKTHALVACAMDAVAHGDSVLVATQSLHAAEVLADLLARYPGPTPVVFGSSEQRAAVATQLAAGLPAGPHRRELARVEVAVTAAAAHTATVRQVIGEALDRERLAGRGDELAALAPSLAVTAPGAFDLGVSHDRALALLEHAQTSAHGWWHGRRRGRAERRLRRLLRADRDAALERVALALEVARSRRAAAELASYGGTAIGGLWDELAEAEERLAEAVGGLVDARARDVPAGARASAAALGTALRAGRGRRREMLARMDGAELVRALPLWIGTLRDVDDLLPRVPGLFDRVILDEASQIDQIRAAPALLRARRALVGGDPRQLRHVSFVADLDVAARIEEHRLGALADRIDVRRSSALDTAASVAASTWLDEHFRSVPHLITFSAERFYPQPIRLMTRHPRSDDRTAIAVVHVDGARDGAGVNAAEVSAALEQLAALQAQGADSVAVISPFRAQADALEEAILAAYEVEAIEGLGLRSGTVHELQGNERDVVVISLALGAGDPPGVRRFVEDPNLFNVMVTRARRRMIVLTSLGADCGGLLGDYLAHAHRSPAPPDASGTVDAWTRAVHDELVAAGTPVRAGYPVGRWSVDLCVGDGADAVGVECCVHPDGWQAHIDRHRALRRAGWRLVDAFPTRYDGDHVRAAIDLATVAMARGTRSP